MFSLPGSLDFCECVFRATGSMEAFCRRLRTQVVHTYLEIVQHNGLSQNTYSQSSFYLIYIYFKYLVQENRNRNVFFPDAIKMELLRG